MKKINAFYRMLIVFFMAALLAKLVGLLTVWHEVPLWFMVQVFFFAGVSHFTKLRHEFAKMIPSAIPAKMFWVYFTGVLEIVGAIDLIELRTRYYAGWALIVFLILVFPANFYAAKKNIKFRGQEPLSIPQRGAVQIGFIIALYFGAIHFA